MDFKGCKYRGTMRKISVLDILLCEAAVNDNNPILHSGSGYAIIRIHRFIMLLFDYDEGGCATAFSLRPLAFIFASCSIVI